MKTIKIIRHFLHETGATGRYLGLLALRTPFEVLRTIINAVFLMKAFEAIEHRDVEELTRVCALFGIACIILFVYNGVVWRYFASMNIDVAKSLRCRMFGVLCKLPLRYLEKRSQGNIMTMLNVDCEMTIELIGGSMNIPHFCVSVLNICVSSVVLFRFSPLFFVVSMVFIILHVLVSRFCVARPISRYQKDVQEAFGTSASTLTAMVESAETALMYDAQDFILRRYEEESLKIMKARMKIVMRKVINSALMPLLGYTGYLVLIFIGGGMIAEGTLDFGSLTAALQYRGAVLASAMMMINCTVNICANHVGAERVEELLREEEAD